MISIEELERQLDKTYNRIETSIKKSNMEVIAKIIEQWKRGLITETSAKETLISILLYN
jgi:Asp-tRNA(Asn)/Glu-tRNA(Gln) amidotransferase B subunit